MKRFVSIFAIAFMLSTLSFSSYAKEVGPEDLVYMCEDIPPSNYVQDGELKGISVEMLRLIWSKMGVAQQPIKVVPWARGYNLLQTEKNQVLFSMSRTKEREALFKWVGPIFSAKNVLLGRAGRNYTIKKLADAKKFRIGTIKDDYAEKYLSGAGFDKVKVEGVASLEQNFGKLRSGRIDLIAHTEQTLFKFIKENRLSPKEFKVYFVVTESPNYYAFSKETPDYLIRRFQKAFDNLRKEHREVLRRYEATP
jgi:polar amino acid transport system substrate-binding protein